MKDLFNIKLFYGMMLVALCLVGCTKLNDDNNDSDSVRVTTYTPTDITSNSAACGGDAIVEGNLFIRELGVCWSTSFNPTVFDNKQSTNICNQPYVCNIENLTPNTNYHVRAYAFDGTNYYYGVDKAFSTLANGGGGSNTNYAEMILGGWECELDNQWNITYYFNQEESGKLNYQCTHTINGSSIYGDANYTIHDSVITASFYSVYVFDANFNPTTINGFTHEQPITVTYTIKSVTDNVLVIEESLQGNTLTLERYN